MRWIYVFVLALLSVLLYTAKANPFEVPVLAEGCVRQGGICLPVEDCEPELIAQISLLYSLCPKNPHYKTVCCYLFIRGVVTKDSLRSEATNPKGKGPLNFNEPIIRHVMKKYYKIAEKHESSTIGLASRILDIAPFVVVVEEYLNGNNNVTGSIPKGIITSDIILDYVLSAQCK